MELEYIVSIVTMIVTYVLGIIAKKNPKISNKIIPIQNLIVGLIIAIIEYIVTKDFKIAIMLSGLLAGGTYDLVHNINSILKGDE